MTNSNQTIPRRFLPHDFMQRLQRHTDARIAQGQAGAGQTTDSVLRFALDHARARDAISSQLDADRLAADLQGDGWPLTVDSAATSRETYLTRPDLGRQLSENSIELLRECGQTCDLCIVVADGLSALAVNENAVPLINALKERLGATSIGTVLLRNGRVAAGDRIAVELGARAVLVLIGERPGLSAADSLGAYLTWGPRHDSRDSERFCVSNIRSGGMQIPEAAKLIRNLLERSRLAGRSGVGVIDAPVQNADLEIRRN